LADEYSPRCLIGCCASHCSPQSVTIELLRSARVSRQTLVSLNMCIILSSTTRPFCRYAASTAAKRNQLSAHSPRPAGTPLHHLQVPLYIICRYPSTSRATGMCHYHRQVPSTLPPTCIDTPCKLNGRVWVQTSRQYRKVSILNSHLSILCV